ncbi:GNAT family N-acetyltransferase [Bacillus sp. BGMRC 2118]|nr:GNAT family N-acetyltransferase [Bacillus sp. BGMRC 2118]
MTLVVTRELSERLEVSETDCLFSRLSAIRDIEGNSMGVEIKKFGNATAFSVKNIPGPSYNQVKGLKNGDEQYLEQIIAFYREREIHFQFEITPGNISGELLKQLNHLGYYQHTFHTTLFSSTNELVNNESNPSITIRKLERDEFDIFAEVYQKGFGMPDFLKQGISQNNKILYDNKKWKFYLATINESPAGIGVIFMKNRVAMLAAAATIPAYRNKGIQTELLKVRINHALAEECKLIVGQARFGSVSQNNMERMGMKIAYTKSIWING